MPFRNSVVGGTTLVRPAIRSPNFVAGVSGWSIDADGSAEFNDIVIRGTGLGDAVIIGPAGMPQVEIGSTATAGYIQFPTNRPIENDVSTIIAAVGNSGAANEYATLQIQGPSVDGATDRASILISSQNNDGSSQANINMSAGSAAIVYDETTFVINGQSSAVSALRVNTAAGHTGLLFRLQVNNSDRFFVDNDGRVVASGSNSANSALLVNTAAGHTGNMLRTQLNGADRFVVDNSGVATTYATNAFTTYVPAVTGGGAATFSTQTGWWQRLGKMVFFSAYLVVNVAGSGAANVQVNTPTAIDRTTRQVFHMHGSALGGPGAGEYSALCFTGGAGAVIDRLTRGGANLTGVDLNAGAIITIEGWYREA
ncbi:MAG: hypothetical protein HOV84_17485 [Streptomyces sp.]|nr:hypothetical protein [Streptomyces sp.]